MKKLLCFGFIFVMLVFTGCSQSYYYDYDTLKKDVVTIEIVSINKGKEEKVLTIIREENKDELLSELSKIKFTRFRIGMEKVILEGDGIKMHYKDGTSEILCFGLSEKYDSENKRISWLHRSCSMEEWEDLVSKFADIAVD